jgi:hypothetical protein
MLVLVSNDNEANVDHETILRDATSRCPMRQTDMLQQRSELTTNWEIDQSANTMLAKLKISGLKILNSETADAIRNRTKMFSLSYS